MTYYAALDVSLRSVNVCVIDDQGEIKAEAKLASEVEAIVAWLQGLDDEISAVGLEAGVLTQYLTYGLQAAGYEVVCMEARQVKAALSAMRNKTDKNDARGIAQILRTGWYRRVHVKSIESHRIRALLSSRKAVLNKCIDLENEVRGLFKVFGIKLPGKLGQPGTALVGAVGRINGLQDIDLQRSPVGPHCLWRQEFPRTADDHWHNR